MRRVPCLWRCVVQKDCRKGLRWLGDSGLSAPLTETAGGEEHTLGHLAVTVVHQVVLSCSG